jgi:cobalt-zinc-cadmium efflux system outer membrane protein
VRLRDWIFVFAATLPCGAQPLAQLIGQALQRNRDILVAQKRYESMAQRPEQAASLPDPTVSLGYASNGWPWPGAGLGHDPTSNIGVMLGQTVPFPGKRPLRGQIAGKEAEATRQEYLATRLHVIAQLKQAYHELHHAVVAIGFIDRYQELLENILRASEARYAVGRAAQQDVLKAQTQLAVFETQRERYRLDRTNRQTEINALLDRPLDTPVAAPPDISAGDLPFTLDDLLGRARRLAPELERDRTLVERSELAANLARKDVYPDYTVSGGYFNQGGMAPMWELRVDFSLPVHYWQKQHAAIAEQEYAATEARHQYEASRVSLESRIRQAYAEAATAQRLTALYEKSVIPEAQLSLDSSLAGYETGKVDFVSVFSGFMNVVDFELMDHEAIMQFHVALARLEELAGLEVRE